MSEEDPGDQDTRLGMMEETLKRMSLGGNHPIVNNTVMEAGACVKNYYNFTYTNNLMIQENVPVAETRTGGFPITPSPTVPDDPVKSVLENKVVSPTKTILVLGIIGTDQKGNTYAPQKSMFAVDKENTKQVEDAKKIINKNLEKWNSLPGCTCVSFSFDMHNWSGPLVNVVGGMTYGFTNSFLPEIKENKKDEMGAK